MAVRSTIKTESVRVNSRVIKNKIASTNDLFIHLIKRGYQYYKPQSSTWKSAFVFRLETSVLCILFRKNGIDLRLYENYQQGISIKNRNIISMQGGEIFRNHYNESNNLILLKIKIIADCFAGGRPIPEIRIEEGKSFTLNEKYQSIREKSKEYFDNEYDRLKAAKNSRQVSEYMRESGGWNDF